MRVSAQPRECIQTRSWFKDLTLHSSAAAPNESLVSVPDHAAPGAPYSDADAKSFVREYVEELENSVC